MAPMRHHVLGCRKGLAAAKGTADGRVPCADVFSELLELLERPETDGARMPAQHGSLFRRGIVRRMSGVEGKMAGQARFGAEDLVAAAAVKMQHVRVRVVAVAFPALVVAMAAPHYRLRARVLAHGLGLFSPKPRVCFGRYTEVLDVLLPVGEVEMASWAVAMLDIALVSEQRGVVAEWLKAGLAFCMSFVMFLDADAFRNSRLANLAVPATADSLRVVALGHDLGSW